MAISEALSGLQIQDVLAESMTLENGFHTSEILFTHNFNYLKLRYQI